MVEHLSLEQGVGGSSPSLTVKGVYASRQSEWSVKPVPSGFVGANPATPMIVGKGQEGAYTRISLSLRMNSSVGQSVRLIT